MPRRYVRPAAADAPDVWGAIDRSTQVLDAAFEQWTSDPSSGARLAVADAAEVWVRDLEGVLGWQAGCGYRTALLSALDAQNRAQRVVGALVTKDELTAADRCLMQQVWAEEREARRRYEDVEAATYVALAQRRDGVTRRQDQAFSAEAHH